MEFGYNSLSNLAKIRKDIKRMRISSYDRTGANADFQQIKSGEKYILCDLKGMGCIKHIWMTLASIDPYYLRKIILRMWWDGEKDPSVEVPIGDFFGVGHAVAVNYWSLPLAMGPQDGKGFNCFFPMPFKSNAKFEVENETEKDLICYFYVDYEEYESFNDEYGRFHATWNRLNPCKGDDYASTRKVESFLKKNPNHENDFMILEAEGEGHYVGCHLDIYNLFDSGNKKRLFIKTNWPGEGDDYIEIDDGEIKIYGTGTEDYFCTSWCPNQTYFSPYFGITLPGGKDFSGKISYYRYHIEDPIYFHKNIKVKIEHGHANQRSDDFSSTAYWYQCEPHKKFDPILPVHQRLPSEEPKETPLRKS